MSTPAPTHPAIAWTPVNTPGFPPSYDSAAGGLVFWCELDPDAGTYECGATDPDGVAWRGPWSPSLARATEDCEIAVDLGPAAAGWEIDA